MSFYWETNRSPLWNNPFLQNDLVAQHSQRYTNISDITAHRSPLTTMELTNSEPSKSPNIAETPPLGFVQRMRQKFDDLSRKAAQSASISPHSRKKRYPSADDILADNDELSFSLANRMVHLPTTTMQENADEIHQSDTIDSFRNESTKTKVSPISRPTSLFQQSVSFDDDEQLIITKPLREVSVLRQKFEEISNFDMFGSIKRVNSNRLRRYNRRHLSDSSLNEPNEETEFIQAYRRLKRSSPIYRHKENTSPYESYDELERKKAKNASYADPTGLLIVGSTARIFFERDITETQRPLLPVRVVDLINPPDPVSARDTYNPNLLEENISFGVQANDYNSPVNDKNQSPPPEEPKPTFLSETDESLPTLTDKTSFISVQTVPPSALIRRDILSAKISDNNCPSDSEKQFPWSRSRPQPNTAVNELDEVRRLVRKFTASREKQAALLDETLQMASPKEIPQPPTIIRQPQITPRYVSFGIRDLPSSTYVVTKLTASPNEYKPLIPEKPVHYGRQLMDRSAVTPAKISSSSTHVVTIVVGDDDSRYFTQASSDASDTDSVDAQSSSHSGEQQSEEEINSAFPSSQQISNDEANSPAWGSTRVVAPPTPPYRPSERRTVPPRPSDGSQRRSLSQKFLESKAQRRDQVIHEDASELECDQSMNECDQNLLKTQSSNRDATLVAEQTEDASDASDIYGSVKLMSKRYLSEEEHAEIEKRQREVDAIRARFSAATTCGDGNPCRYSLINVVDQDDIPQLLEAMAEEFHYVFEDVPATTSNSVNGIIGRKKHNKAEKASARIGFIERPPTVFSYPNESTIAEQTSWLPGEYISYEDYRKLREENDRARQAQQREMNRWESIFLASQVSDTQPLPSSVCIEPSASDYAMGVTSCITYDAANTFSSLPGHQQGISVLAGGK